MKTLKLNLTPTPGLLFLANFTFLLSFFFVSKNVNGQTLINQLWTQTLNYPDTVPWSASVANSGGDLFTTGNTWHNATQKVNIVTTKTNSSGTIIWTTEYNGTLSGFDYGSAIALDNSGNIFVAGATHNTSAYTFDIVVIKYNSSGSQQWATLFNGAGSGMDIPSGITFDDSGNIYICGATTGSTTGYDYVTIKLNSSGTQQWAQTYDYNSLSDLPGYITWNSGTSKIGIAGASQSTSINWDYTTLKYNTSGTLTNTNRTSTSGYGFDRPTGLVTDASDNYYITGYAYNGTDYDLRTVKLDDDLTPVWTVTEDEGFNDGSNGITIDGSGNTYICGYITNSVGSEQMQIIKYNSSGVKQWTQTLDNNDNSLNAQAVGIKFNSTNNRVVVTGYYQYVSGKKVITTFALAHNNGEMIWQTDFPNIEARCDNPKWINASSNFIWVTGTSTINDTTRYITIKYETYDRDFTIVDDEINEVRYLNNQVIVSFDPKLMDFAFVDDRQTVFTDLENAINDSLYDLLLPIIDGGGQFTPVAIKVFKKLTSSDTISITRLGSEIRIPEFWSSLVITTAEDPMDLLEELNDLGPGVIHAELNLLYELSDLPDDIQTEQESLYDPIDANDDINVVNAWDLETGKPYVNVGIYDSGILWKHEELGDGTAAGSIVTGGYDYEHSHDYTGDPNYVSNSYYHGTAVAGIVGAMRDNDKGIAGIAGGTFVDEPNGVSLTDMEITVYGFYEEDRGGVLMEYAVDALFEGATVTPEGDLGYGLDIINCSWGGDDPSVLLLQAIGYVFSNQVTIVGAKGNDELNVTTYPADINDVQVISVGGSGDEGEYDAGTIIADDDGANYGGNIDIIAPYGLETLVYTLDNTDSESYTDFDGTSGSTPHVSGVAALMASYLNNPDGESHIENIAPEDIENILQLTADDAVTFGTNWDSHTGWGLIDAEQAFSLIEKPHYKLQHFCTEYNSPGDMELDEEDLLIELDEWTFLSNGQRIAPGDYIVDRYKIDETLNHSLSPSAVIIDYWKLPSISDVMTVTFPSNVNIDYIMGTPTTTSVDVTAYAYHFKEWTYGGGTEEISRWIPQNIFDMPLQVCYTLLTYDDEATSVQELSITKDISVTLFPNPASNQITINFALPQELSLDNVKICFTDLSGKVVLNTDLSNVSNLENLNFDVSQLAAGMYNITLTSNSFIKTINFIKN